MKDAPEGWPRITPAVFYDDPGRAIEWLCDVLGFEVRVKVETADGGIAHSELTFDGGVIMVGSTTRHPHRRSPRALEGWNTQSLMIYVDDVDAHCERARSKGAKIMMEPKTTDYGQEWWTDRSYQLEDCEGHQWWFVQRLRSPSAPPPKCAKE